MTMRDDSISDSIPLEYIKMNPETGLISGNPSDPSFDDLDDSLMGLHQLQALDSPKYMRFLRKLWQGPQTPSDDPPQPFKWGILSTLESLPQKFSERASKNAKVLGLSAYLFLWFLVVYNILSPYFTVPPGIHGKDIPVISLSCTDQLWLGKNAKCGLDGLKCLDESSEDVFIRCPALCDRSWTYSLEPIGDQRVKYRGYFIGGGEIPKDKETLTNPYRSDSYICGSAVHAGLVSPFYGGCARLSYSGSQVGFESAKGYYGVDDSLGFASFFPSSYVFKTMNENVHGCYDPRLPILMINILLGIPIVYMASGPVIFWTITSVGFWTIALATDPPVKVDSNDSESYAALLSLGLERFLPTCFILYALWRASTSITLGSITDPEKVSHLSRLIYFYPFFWLGVLNNISFDRLPVDRFTLNDLKTQPGGAIAVSGIVLLVVTCAIIQAYKIWEAGIFRKYLVIYISFIGGLTFISLLPGLTLRVHHYILAMLLIPGCCTRGTTALLFQGILLGLFLSGAARWGLAAIAETATSLRRNDPSGQILPPEIMGFDLKSGILSWADTSVDELYTGVSILINDIERFVAENVTSVNLVDLFNTSTLSESIQQTLDSKFAMADSNIPLYIRIGKKIMGTTKYSDFSNAAVLKWPSGHLELPKPGVT